LVHRMLRALAALGVLAGLLTAAPVRAESSDHQARCREVAVPVSIAEGQPARYQLWGSFCAPAGRGATTVQVLLHGLNYSHVYWDFPFQPARYSYVRRANGAGYATFNVDRIGVGRSSHPPSGEVTLQSNAFTVHQVVAALRAGTIAGHAVTKVVLVGHSYGSEVAKLEASRYGDVDALVLTGNGHVISPSAVELAVTLGQPVQEVPRLAAEVPPGDDGYGTVQDAQRPLLMYNVARADPRVIALDAATKETNTLGELLTLGDANAPGVTAHLRVPLLIVNGTEDRLACAPDATDCSSAATLEAAERPFYPEARVDAVVVVGAGHAINLHRNAHAAYSGMVAWTDRHVGTG